jgi:phenylacetate-CoA ligase
LEAIQTIGEPLTDDVRQRIETAFGAPTRNLYSATEFGSIASPCPTGSGLHVHSESVLAEVLDGADQPCQPGTTGRLVLTSLTNFITPFIRYEILDEATLAIGPCPCGRGLPLWTRVDGRRHPMLHLPGGRRKASTGLMLGMRQIGGVHQFQVVQMRDSVLVNVVPSQAWTSEHIVRIRAFVQTEVESPCRVDVVQYKSIPKPASGKIKIIEVEDT